MTRLRSSVFKLAMKYSKLFSTPVTDQNLAKKRLDFAKLERYFPTPKDVVIEPVKTADISAEWVTVPVSRPDKVMLYMHGGGFILKSNLYRDLVSRIARAGQVRALSLDYSLSPEYPFPKAVHETVAAYKWLLKTYSPPDIVLAGDSAGGALVLSSLHQMREAKLPYPACAIVMSPATDATLTSLSLFNSKDPLITRESLGYFIDAYFQDTPRDHPIGSPLHGSLEGFPPILIHADKDEIMYGDSARFIEKAKKAGVDATLYEEVGLWHVWHAFARYIPEARKAIENMGQFMQKYLEASGSTHIT